MRAAVLSKGRIRVRDDVAEPVPAEGQVLVQVHACGICGSDLHFVQHSGEMRSLRAAMGMGDATDPEGPDLDRDVYMGHEFAAEVLEAGPDTETFPPGTIVTSLPTLAAGGDHGRHSIGYSNVLHGGFGERMLLSAELLLEVPNGLSPRDAALTEPIAVGLHAVNRSTIAPGDAAIVVGCGPVGLAIIASLARRGVEPIVAADYSAGRRAVAAAMGAHELVDPRDDPGWSAYRRAGAGRSLVVFEAVGVPGMIDEIMRWAPPHARVLIAGACMEADTIHPVLGISKELSLYFAVGSTPAEFGECLHAIAEGEIDVRPMVTGEVGLDGVADAFAELATPDAQCKIIVAPSAP